MAGYGTDEGLTAYAAANGLTLPEGGNLAAARQRGSLYVDAVYGGRFPGQPTGGISQEREWPRTGAVDAYGNELPSDTVPSRVEWAAYEAAIVEVSDPWALSPVAVAAEMVKREKVGPIEQEFFASGSAAEALTPTVTAIDGILRTLLVGISFDELLPAILVV